MKKQDIDSINRGCLSKQNRIMEVQFCLKPISRENQMKNWSSKVLIVVYAISSLFLAPSAMALEINAQGIPWLIFTYGIPAYALFAVLGGVVSYFSSGSK